MKSLRIAILTATLALTAQAQEIQWGAQGGLNIPLGDLADATDSRLGITLGGHAGIYYGNGHELRPRLDFTHYGGGWHPVPGGFAKNTIDAWGLGADYLYYVEARNEGFYLTMGLGYQWWTVSPNEGPNHNESGLALAAGAGMRWTKNFSLEARITTGSFQKTSGQATALQLGASYRF